MGLMSWLRGDDLAVAASAPEPSPAPAARRPVALQQGGGSSLTLLQYLQNRDRTRYNHYPRYPNAWDVREARFLSTETSFGRHYLELALDSALGAEGIRLDVKPPVVMREWDAWAAKAGLDGESFVEMQERALMALLRDGEILTEMVSDGGELRVYLHDSLSLDYVNGIEFGMDGRPRSYSFRAETADLDGYARPPSARSRMVAAGEIDHVFQRLTPNQTRGRSWYSPAFGAFHDLARISTAMLKNAQAAAEFPGFWTAAPEYVLRDFVQDSGAANWSAMQAEGGGDDVGGTGSVDGSLLRETLLRVPQEDQLLPSGTEWHAMMRAAGFSLGSDYPGVRAAILAEMAAGLGVSFHALTGNVESANFSSLRHANENDKRFVQRIQRIMSGWSLRVYARWYRMAVGSSGISARSLRQAKTPTVIKPAWSYIEPLKESSAQKMMIETGTMSRSEVIRDSGRDPEKVFAELKAEREMMSAPRRDDNVGEGSASAE